MRNLVLLAGATLTILTVLGCSVQPPYRPEDDQFLLENQSVPPGDPSEAPFRPHAPVQLVIPAGPRPESPPR